MMTILLCASIGLNGLLLGLVLGQNFMPNLRTELNSILDRIDGDPQT